MLQASDLPTLARDPPPMTLPRARALALAALLLAPGLAAAQRPPGFNYDEAKVPAYTLPDPLTLQDGGPVATFEDWWQRRRPEILRLFESHVYGRTPAASAAPTFRVRSVERGA